MAVKWLGRKALMLVSIVLSFVLLERMLLPPGAGVLSSSLSRSLAQSPTSSPLYSAYFDEHVAQMGLFSSGDDTRTRAVMARLVAGAPVKITVIGGSISAGNGGSMNANISTPLPGYVEQFAELLRRDFPNAVVENRAFGATSAGFTGSCVDYIVDADTDLVITEFSANEKAVPPGCTDEDLREGHGCFRSPSRAAFERLLRRLLELPRRPAVVLLHAYVDRYAYHAAFATNEFNVFAEYYGLPIIAARAFYHHITQGRPGYRVDLRRFDLPRNDTSLDSQLYFYDTIHPFAETGHRYMAELVQAFVRKAQRSLEARPLTEDDIAYVSAPLPPPLLPGNYAPNTSTCYINDHFLEVVRESSGFEWVNDRPGASNKLAKWGWVGARAGDWTLLQFSSVIPDGGNSSLLNLGYLKSYEGTGKGRMECISGCTCKPRLLDGHQDVRVSTTEVIALEVSQHERCTLNVTVLTPVREGEERVKLISLVLLPVGSSHGHHGSTVTGLLNFKP